MSAAPDIPQFAVVGRVNKGKSSILATLVEEADNRRIRVSNTPGETTRCYSIPLALHGETLVEFIDTPGFNRARQTLDWLQKRHDRTQGAARIEVVQAFVTEHREAETYLDECELLQPILDGAGILYVVDASKPFRADFLAEMEILRWTGRPRMAIINNISAETDFTAEWKQHLGEHFNLTREFNAHTARFRERIRLLRSLLEIEDDGEANILKTVTILEREWNQRRSRASDIILDLLRESLTHRSKKTLSREDADRDYRKQEIVEELKKLYVDDLQKMETRHHQELVQLYRHDSWESVSDDVFTRMAEDLFSEETWEVFGLNRWQLGVAGGVAGAASGGAVDLATAGTTGGAGLVLGGLLGWGAAMYKGRALADIKISNPVGQDLQSGGVAMRAGPPKNPNFPWIILDRALFQYEHSITRAHGRRDDFKVDLNALNKDGERAGWSSKLAGSSRRTLQKWFNALSDGKTVEETGPIFEEIREVLERIEAG